MAIVLDYDDGRVIAELKRLGFYEHMQSEIRKRPNTNHALLTRADGMKLRAFFWFGGKDSCGWMAVTGPAAEVLPIAAGAVGGMGDPPTLH